MKRGGILLGLAAAAVALVPASAGAVQTRPLAIDAPAARDCAEGFLPSRTRGVARERWRAPGTGHLTLKLGGDPYAPDWDLAARSGGTTYASTSSGSTEVVTLWVRRGDRVAIQACRLGGGDRRVPLTVDLYEMAIPRADERVSLESVALERPRDLERLEALGLDVTHDVGPQAATVALHSDAERARLAATGLESRTLVADLAARDRAHLVRATRRDARSALPSGRDGYRQYEDYTSEMKALAQQYPGHVRSITIGTTLEGRPIEGVEIAGNVDATDDGRPIYLNLGTHHAREWPSGEFPMEFAIDLATGYGTDPRITAMLDRARVIIVPVVNADGFVASRSFGTSPADDEFLATAPLIASGAGAYRRKNCRGVSPADQAIPCAARTTGVDLNRNYGAYWGGPGSSSDPVGPEAQIYRGAAPFSEPESQAVLALSESVHPTVVISNHTFTDEGMWLRQPGFDGEFMPRDADGALTPDEPALADLGDRMAAASGWLSTRAFAIGSITGATEDWNYFAQGAYGYTPEARGPNFHANYASMVVAEYVGSGNGGVREAFLRAGEEAADPDNHGVITGGAPPGAQLRIEKRFKLPTCDGQACEQGNGEPVGYEIRTHLTVPASGQYEWHVNQSTRPDVYARGGPPVEAWTMTCKLPDRERSVAQQVLVGRGERVTVDWIGLCRDAQPDARPDPTCGGQRISVIGTRGADNIVGTPRSDIISAGKGKDTVRSGRGKDVVCGAGGRDTLKGGPKADTLFGQRGGDRLSGATGNDTLRGAKGRDRLSGGKGRNTCVGGSGRDRFSRSCR